MLNGGVGFTPTPLFKGEPLMEISNEIKTFINRHWKPNQDDSYVVAIKNSKVYHELKQWFDSFLTPNQDDYQSEKLIVNIGPFVKIQPYGVFDVEGEDNKVEFLFIYETIDKSKLEAHHLLIA